MSEYRYVTGELLQWNYPETETDEVRYLHERSDEGKAGGWENHAFCVLKTTNF